MYPGICAAPLALLLRYLVVHDFLEYVWTPIELQSLTPSVILVILYCIHVREDLVRKE